MSAVAPTPKSPAAEYVCGSCGYGIRVGGPPLPPCPMCRSHDWRGENQTESDHAE